MERISKHIARNLLDLLPDDEEYYKIDDLRDRGFPNFVVQRIQVELERNLAESIVPPQTDWAYMKSAPVQEAWSRFINAIREEARLPASFTLSVVETALEDITDLLVQPRKNLPEIIFGASETLDYEEVVNRMDAVVVYRHFASLIPRYMERKGLEELTREQCSNLVSRADEKLTQHYTPLNWAQMLEPLFTLLDEQIDSNLLRLFFEDKNLPQIARGFDMMNKSLNRAQLIEVLSSPELLNFEGYQDKREQSPEQKNMGWKPKMDRPKEAGASAEHDLEDEDPIISKFHKTRGKGSEISEEKGSLNTVFSEEEEEDAVRETSEDDADDTRDQVDSLNAVFSAETTQEAAGEQDEGMDDWAGIEEFERKQKERAEAAAGKKENKSEPEPGASGSEKVEERSKRDTPMWERFLTPEGKAEMERQREEEEGLEEDPIINLPKEEEPDEGRLKRLNELLEDEKERFVEDIFRGAPEAYEEAVQEIASKEDWRSASRYIEKDIFKRNLVDMYSETAVDFTDRLQSYFTKASKSN